jgi:hypothetical protein
MLDVHPPNEPVYRWRDFFIHLATITIGLLIALSLEGCVEWQHHRHLVHEAEKGLRGEIKSNAGLLPGVIEDLHREQAVLKNDVAVLNRIIANPRVVNREDMTINYKIRSFNNVSWKTSQTTGALSYMPYAEAHEYSDIYDQQNDIEAAQHQGVRDTVIAIAPFLNLKADDPNPTGDEAARIKNNLEILQGQLIYQESLVAVLADEYKKFLAAHPE